VWTVSGLTRKEQWERTHERLLDATIHCLVTYGYAGTTTQRIQDRAGVSRGALLHHFGSKHELLVAAIHHIADLRLRDFTERVAGQGEGPEALEQMVAAIRSVMTGPPFQAAIELWSASRTDTELREALLPAERRLGRNLRGLFNQHSGISDPDVARIAFESLMALVRGLELTRIMRADQAIADRVVSEWLNSLRQLRTTSTG
jgi:AcrR family transcriptional regulator